MTAPAGGPHPRPARPRVVPGLLALTGSAVVMAACFIPWSSNFRVISPGGAAFSDWFWLAVEPILVVGFSCAVGVSFLHGTPRAPWRAGAMIGVGAQTTALFLGFAVTSLLSSFNDPGAGGFVGMLGGLLILAAGVTASG